MTATAPIDLPALIAACADDRALALEVIRVFLTEGPLQLKALENAPPPPDPAFARAAHRLKGSLLAIHAPVAAALARQCEQATALPVDTLESLRAAMRDLVREAERLTRPG